MESKSENCILYIEQYIADRKLSNIFSYSFIDILTKKSIWLRSSENEINSYLLQLVNSIELDLSLEQYISQQYYHAAAKRMVDNVDNIILCESNKIFTIFNQIPSAHKIFFVYCLFEQIIYQYKYSLSKNMIESIYIKRDDIQSSWYVFHILIDFLKTII